MTVYRSAAGSTVTMIGGGVAGAGGAAGAQPTNWTIDFRPMAERVPGAWRSVRFRPDPPRLTVWFRGDAAPMDIPLEDAHIST